jgi:hypothetical protein
MIRRACGLLLAAFPAAIFAWAPSARSQTVRGTLLEEGTGNPVPGAFVVLEDSTGEVVSTSLTGPPGTWLLRAPVAGTYRVRADRIGYASVISEAFAIGATETLSRVLKAPVAPVALSGIDVEAAGRCEMLREESLTIHRVWEEARKALAAISWTGQQPYFRFDAVHFQRELAADGTPRSEIEYEEVRYFGRHPFHSIPTRDLMLGGFVQEVSGSLRYYAPDADVLLSADFLRRHCFRLVRSDGEQRLGLAFEPQEEARLTDISGTMWVNPETAELASLDFRYENLDLGVNTRHLGGRVDFVRMPSGVWFVRSWAIRVPVIEFEPPGRTLGGRARPARRRLVAIDEGGGHVTAVYMTSRLAGSPSTDTLPVRPPPDSLIGRFPLPD